MNRTLQDVQRAFVAAWNSRGLSGIPLEFSAESNVPPIATLAIGKKVEARHSLGYIWTVTLTGVVYVVKGGPDRDVLERGLDLLTASPILVAGTKAINFWETDSAVADDDRTFGGTPVDRVPVAWEVQIEVARDPMKV